MIKYIFDYETLKRCHKEPFHIYPENDFWYYDGCDGKEPSDRFMGETCEMIGVANKSKEDKKW